MQALHQEAVGCVSASGMREIEAGAMASGIGESALMGNAGTRLGHAIARFFTRPGTAVAWPGKGHNGGDALIALRVLRDDHGWRIRIRHVFPETALAPLTRNQLAPHRETPDFDCGDPALRHPLILIDGLLGIGADGSSLRGPLADAANEINHLRETKGAVVVAVDLPSGINPDTGAFPSNSVRADVTFTLGAVKSGLIQPAAANVVGALSLVSIPELTAGVGCGPALICPQHPHATLFARPYDFHKGMAGRVAILAGSESYSGAAVLCASAALAGGAGLVTLHVPRAIHQLVAVRCAPEIIVRPFDSLDELGRETPDAWVVGCGLGADWGDDLISFIATTSEIPMVIDADALNAIAREGALGKLGANHLLTPHPGEFRRLAPHLPDLAPLDAATAWVRDFPATLLLKGCRSVIAARGHDPLVNSTGHPGMATAGQGDVLAGVAGALLAAKQPLPGAAAMAAWLCGRAAERAVHHGDESAESLRATSVIQNLGGAFHDWRAMTR